MTGTIGKRKNIFLVWLIWPFITLGVYFFVWTYKINRETKDFDHRVDVNPFWSMMSFLVGWIIIVPPFVSTYRLGQRIAQDQEAAGMRPSCNPWIGLILFFIAGLSALYYQNELNSVWEHYGTPPEGTRVPVPRDQQEPVQPTV
ncbi:DUF4234 domain-containing protein [Yinghuangia seranimata]|uniref:DUF4234 domain-containing protein n=1 Tax=Yinghuangia seranimata TaxID=408067 RepID=UPI00248ACE28|nr:DUF4234 domain-containing protein [Yinghuangia seranimata]MDI2131231.1 DUF4234 domain-containing protein [Yinghuangia seranimata]